MSDQIVCEICGFAKSKPQEPQTQAVRRPEEESDEQLRDDFQRAYHKADAAVVYILGYKTEDGITRKQVDVFGAINGFHLRSMPDRRWNNPVLVGAGSNYVAVVDRFKDVDVIRITDPLFGLDTNNYDDLGMPKEEIDLEHVEDIARVTAPSGSRVTGVTILPRGILVANITKNDGVPRYVKVDVDALLNGRSQPGFNGIDTLADPFNTFGDMVAAPAPYDIALGPRMYLFATIVSNGAEKHGIALVDIMQGTVQAYVGLPGKYKPLSLAHGQGVIHVLVQTGSAPQGSSEHDPPFGNKVLRIPVVYGNYMLSGGKENDSMVLEPQDFDVKQTYQSKDAAGQTIQLPAYLEGARQLNSNYDDEVTGPTINPDDVRPAGIDKGSSQVIAPRTQETDDDAAMPTYSDGRSVPVRVITLPSNRRVFSLGAISNTLLEAGYEPEIENNAATGKPNNLKSYFYAMHNSHYDYLADGGFIYGCTKQVPKTDGNGNPVEDEQGNPVMELKTSVLLGNDYVPMAMGYDNIVASGDLRSLPDMGVLLVDNVTNRVIYRYPKNLGVQVYSGEYASVKHAESNQMKRSSCSDDADALAAKMDGIKRPVAEGAAREAERDPKPIHIAGHTDDFYPVAEYGNDREYDEPFELLDRRIAPGKKQALIQLDNRRWSMRENDPFALFKPALLPEWRNGLIFSMKNPCTVDKSSDKGETFWPKGSSSTLDPKFTASAAAGFWFLNLRKERTRMKDELQLDIQDLLDEIEALQTQREALETQIQSADETTRKELQAQIKQIENDIQSRQNQIEAKQQRISEMGDDYESNPILFKTPRNIMKTIYKMDYHAGQEIDVRDGASSIKRVTPIIDKAKVWEPCKIEVVTLDEAKQDEVKKTCQGGIIVDPGIRSWIGLDILCNYWGVVTDGVANYAHDETLENGLGRCLGASPYLHGYNPRDNPFGRFPGNEYEAGYTCSTRGDGAIGQFEVLVLFNGKPAKEIATQVTYLEQIMHLAPEEIQDKLFYDMMIRNVGIENGFHKGKVYYSDEIITEVTIRVRLINYAHDVFRYGFNTVEIYHNWWPNCPGYDPGYWAGNDCEGMACGNVQCTSMMFGGNHKLRADDPVYPLTKQLVWEGEAVYTIEDGANPFLAKNQQVGYFMDCYFDFDLMAPMNAYRVDISQNTYQGGGGGGHNLSW